MKGSGCQTCSNLNRKFYGNTKTTLEEFINKANEIHENVYDYSNVDYINNNIKVIIKCLIHEDFEMTPNSHISNKQGCPKCGIEKTRLSKLRSNKELINAAIKTHGNKYDYSKLDYTNYSRNNRNVEIICKNHGSFFQNIDSHILGYGCKNCCTYNPANKDTLEDFIEKAKLKHNNKYDYNKVVYINGITPIIIICPKHGDFLQKPTHHLRNKGCNLCGIDTVKLIKQKTTQEFIKLAREVHGYKFDYSNVNYENYDKKNNNKIEIICKTHGSFFQLPAVHLQGYKCSRCSGNKLTQKDFINKCIKQHGNKYDYSDTIYKNGTSKVIIICPKHGEFKQAPKSHMNGTNCPKCSYNNYSKISITWIEYLKFEYNNLQYALSYDGEYHIPTTKYKADGYCKETNTIFEFLGDFWHSNPKLYNINDYNKLLNITHGENYEKTVRRKNEIIELGYNYIEMWECVWRKTLKAIIKIQRAWRKKLTEFKRWKFTLIRTKNTIIKFNFYI